jgi:hypothetical protein
MPIISLSNDNPVPVLSNTTEVEASQEALQSAINTIEPGDIFDITGATTGMVVRFNGVDLVVAQLNASDLNNDSNFIAQGDNVSTLVNDAMYLTVDDDVVLQSYATGGEPASPPEGTMIYDTDLSQAKYYNGTTWVAL